MMSIIDLFNNEVSIGDIAKRFNLHESFVSGLVLGYKLANPIPETLRYQDICLIPKKNICPSRLSVNISSEIFRGITLDVPLIAANMSSVCNASFCVELYKNGALGVLHRAATNESMVNETKEVAKQCELVATSIGLNDFDLANELIRAGSNILFLDVANGYSIVAIEFIKKLRQQVGNEIKLVIGNTTNTRIMCEVEPYVDAVKIGIAQGDACETFNMTGFTEGQFSAVLKFKLLSRKLGLPIISDGSIKEPQDFVKAIAAGANSVMAGRIFAMCPESAAETIYIKREWQKVYAGMASRHVQNQWRGGLKTGTCPEGKVKYLSIGEPVSALIERYAGALRSGITYGEASNIKEFQDNAEFMRISR